MSSAIIVSAAALAIVVSLAVAVTARNRSNRRFERALERIDEHMDAIVEHVERAYDARRADRADDARRMPTPAGAGGATAQPLTATLELEALLEELASEARARTGADAAVAELATMDGTDRPRRAAVGDPPPHPLLDGLVRSTGTGSFRTMTVAWSTGRSSELGAEAHASALVVPLVDNGELVGAIAAYSAQPEAFPAVSERALGQLAREALPSLHVASRYRALLLESTTDEETGVENERGYRDALEREVARSRRTHRTFSVLHLDAVVHAPRSARPEELWRFASFLADETRATDVVCRRDGSTFALVLPETTRAGARAALERLRTGASSRGLANGGPPTGATGVVEWASGESATALDARARAALGTAGEHDGAAPVRLAERPVDARDAYLAELAAGIEHARRHSSGLALLLVEPVLTDAHRDAASIESAASVLARRLSETAASDVLGRLAASRIALGVRGATADTTESRFDELRDWVRDRFGGDVDLVGGVTTLSPGDRPRVLLERAEQALAHASQAGTGALVVASPADDHAS
jgi:GGDEF domain-containing protein